MDPRSGVILICGLGGLGQACLRTLMGFEAQIHCIDQRQPRWVDGLLADQYGTNLVLGDMRSPEVLRMGRAADARAVLLLSHDSGINLEAALQVRLLNPKAQLVVRTNSSRSLERQLQQRLPGLATVDPSLLTAGVFANALRTDGTEAAFALGDELFRVRSRTVQRDSALDLFDLLGRRERLVQWVPATGIPGGAPASQWWDLDDRPCRGDRLLCLELASTLETRPPRRHRLRAAIGQWMHRLENLAEQVQAGLRRRDPLLIWGCGLLLLALIAGSIVFGSGSAMGGLLLTLALLKGEFLDSVGFLMEESPTASENLALAYLSLLYAVVGTLLTAWLVALILDRLLAQRLGRRQPRPLQAGSQYVLLLEGGRLAERLASLLQLQKFKVVRVEPEAAARSVAGLAYGRLDQVQRALRRSSCQAVGVLGADLVDNLDTALELQERWPGVRLAVQAQSLVDGAKLSSLFSGMQVINPLQVAADAVVATAFGERVRGVLRLAEDNLLLTDYRIEPGDTMAGLSLAAVSGGYGLIPLQVTPLGQRKPIVLPNLERVLQPGDALVVMADLQALLAVENGTLAPPLWQLEVRGCRRNCNSFEAQVLLARYLALAPGEVSRYLETAAGPQRTDAIYQAPGRQLQQGLTRLGVKCALVSAAQAPA